MIEMRWLEREVPEGVNPAELVLQYKVKDDYSGHNEEPDWGDWQDVPVVKETLSHARELERELAEAHKQLAAAKYLASL